MEKFFRKIWSQASKIEKASLIISLIIFTFNTLALLIILKMK